MAATEVPMQLTEATAGDAGEAETIVKRDPTLSSKSPGQETAKIQCQDVERLHGEPTFLKRMTSNNEAKSAAQVLDINVVHQHRLNMPTKCKFVHAEYIWIGGTNTTDVRSKSNTLLYGECPSMWNYDGSSTMQALGHDSEVLIKPVRIYPDPFRKEGDILVLCETMKHGDPHPTNMRVKCEIIMNAAKTEEPMFGIEQEFFVTDNATGKAVGWPQGDLYVPRGQGGYYCGVDGKNVNRNLRLYYESVLENCRKAGLPITGGNFEGAPGQLEFQVCDIGIALCDHVWVLRYIVQRTSQEFGYGVEFKPKPYIGDWSGSGGHCNYSTKSMRQKGGYDIIMEAIGRLEKNHQKHIARYGNGNRERLTGYHETASWEKFSYGVGDREASIRIPVTTEAQKKGYLEDRRPSSSMNPYVVCGLLVQTTLDVCLEVDFPEDIDA